ncbi:hypothetical protein GCM10009578_065360 [Streptomyces rhizosphaericus]|uniref:AbrB/MazE/SpoVT family DNA-binding domain-containing protein n=1 Tax=Streptomyces rhizosphaericus TaxID=114699 RepID=UPI000A381F10|nr:AbrB/MazE/SpoVT family DNA-binding domain-containing protein [Streptomyces rhizosphaericus]
MLREPNELRIGDDGAVELPLGLLAEAGLTPGTEVLAYSGGEGRIILRRRTDAHQELMTTGNLT